MGWADIILGIARTIRETIGQSALEWAELVEQHPVGAASLLDIAAGRLEARAVALRRQDGWRAKRLRARAVSLRREAMILRNAPVLASRDAPWIVK